MTAVAAVQWRKEFRELLPWWSAIVITMLVSWVLMRPNLMPFEELFHFALGLNRNVLLAIALVTYAAGAVSLGATSIGSEYSHNTLTQLLVQPAERAQILQVKLTVLALLLASLGFLAFLVWTGEPGWAGLSDMAQRVLILLPLACGFMLAPWLTMLGHSALGGAVFTAVLPSMLWIASIYGRMPAPILWMFAAVVAVMGPVMTWRTFTRLEVPGSSTAAVDLSAWFSRSGAQTRIARRQPPMWVLIKKELRLQQATLVLSGLYLMVWLVMVADRFFEWHALTNSPLYIATFVNTLLVPLCCGAVASANERQFDVAQWQTLLPIAAWKQWAIKAGVALAMAVALAVVLPMFLTSIATENGWRDGMEPVTVMMLCAAALYVSSLSRTGLRALLFTIPAIALALFVALAPIRVMTLAAQPILRGLAFRLRFVEITQADYSWWMRQGPARLAGGFLLLLLAFGHVNHRIEDRNWRRVARQGGWLLAYTLAATLFLQFLFQLYMVWGRTGGGR